MLVPLTRRYIHMRPPRVWADIVVGLLVICMIIIMMPAKAVAQEEEYLQSLIKHFRFYNTSHGIFAPVYPAIAKQLVEDYGKTKGIAVDLGGADGSLAFALAKVTDLTVYNVDINPGAARICNILADRNQLTGRVRAIEGDATNLPLRDNFADLVFSRNSMIFWPDMILGVREAYRILKPGGVAFMGVGSPRTLDKETLQKLADWAKESGRKMAPVPKDLPKQLSAFGITQVRIIEGPDGSWWVEMRKPVEKK
jgi:SAM-dependent methyltransferase